MEEGMGERGEWWWGFTVGVFGEEMVPGGGI